MEGRTVEIGFKTITIVEDNTAYTGSYIWDCSLVLTYWLDRITNSSYRCPVSEQLGLDICGFKDKKVVELGAGTGLPGMVAALLGSSQVILTDRAGLLPGLQKNVQTNGLEGTVKVMELEWGEDCSELLRSGPVDFILCSDILYNLESMPALAKSLNDLCGENTKILLSYELRAGTTECFKLLREHGFKYVRVPEEELDPHWQSEDIGIFILSKSAA